MSMGTKLWYRIATRLLVAWIAIALSAAFVQAATPIPHITVVAVNPVDGVRVLAKQKDVSFQVFLWRADSYLKEQFKDASFENIKKTLEEAGAQHYEEWGSAEPDSFYHIVRYSIQKDVLKNHLKQTRIYIIEIYHNPRDNAATAEAAMKIDFGIDFKKAAASRAFPKGTVLDRVFGLVDLERRAKDTPRLDSIEVKYGKIGYISSSDLGSGFHLDVSLSDPTGHGRLKEQSVSYMACSGLEPLGSIYTHEDKQKSSVHVARDILIPGAALGDEPEHGYPQTFGSTGSEEIPRSPSSEEAQ